MKKKLNEDTDNIDTTDVSPEEITSTNVEDNIDTTDVNSQEDNIDTTDANSQEVIADKVDDMLIGRIYKKQFAQTKDDLEKILAHKIKQRIDQKKQDFVNNARDNM